jgi:hypothetical protein
MEHFLVCSLFTLFEHMPFFKEFPNLIFVPGTILYMYIHAMIVLYSFVTLHLVCASLLLFSFTDDRKQSNWGSQPTLRPKNSNSD